MSKRGQLILAIAVSRTRDCRPPNVAVVERFHFSGLRQEVARVTSPDGAVDAVMVVIGCGAMCSDTYLVAIVPRGGSAPSQYDSFAFSADDLSDAHLNWKQRHLLEIGYRRVLINQFRNVFYPFSKFGDPPSWNYRVELRLALLLPTFRISAL